MQISQSLSKKPSKNTLDMSESKEEMFIMFNIDVYHLHNNKQCLIFAPSLKPANGFEM